MYAHREEFPEHPLALERLRALAEGDEAWGLPVFVVGEFLRVVTHPRILRPPSPMEAALDALQGLLESPSLRLLRPGERYWSLLDEAIRDARATGNLVVDAEIVAVCREHGATTILTEDRDLRRFRGVTAIPLGGGSPGRSGTR